MSQKIVITGSLTIQFHTGPLHSGYSQVLVKIWACRKTALNVPREVISEIVDICNFIKLFLYFPIFYEYMCIYSTFIFFELISHFRKCVCFQSCQGKLYDNAQ